MSCEHCQRCVICGGLNDDEHISRPHGFEPEPDADDELAALREQIAQLDRVLGAGGICDLDFHIGQVRAMKEQIARLQAERDEEETR